MSALLFHMIPGVPDPVAPFQQALKARRDAMMK